MAFFFQAGPPSYIFRDTDIARAVSEALEREFGYIADELYGRVEPFLGKLSPPGLVRKPDAAVFRSNPLPDDAWTKFRDHVRTLLGAEATPHLQHVKSGIGVYIPEEMEPTSIPVAGLPALQVASLPSLLQELFLYSKRANLPVEEADVYELSQRKNNDPNAATYAELMLACQFSISEGAALWIVE